MDVKPVSSGGILHTRLLPFKSGFLVGFFSLELSMD